MLALYMLFSVADDRLVVMKVRGGEVMVIGLVKTVDSGVVSVTVTLNGKVPAVEGVPEIVAVTVSTDTVKFSPGGTPLGVQA